jgi:hypothetical protein
VKAVGAARDPVDPGGILRSLPRNTVLVGGDNIAILWKSILLVLVYRISYKIDIGMQAMKVNKLIENLHDMCERGGFGE